MAACVSAVTKVVKIRSIIIASYDGRVVVATAIRILGNVIDIHSSASGDGLFSALLCFLDPTSALFLSLALSPPLSKSASPCLTVLFCNKWIVYMCVLPSDKIERTHQ